MTISPAHPHAEFPASELGIYHDQSIAEQITVCRAKEKKLFKRLQTTRDNPLKFRIAVKTYLSSRACKLVAMIEQAKRLEKHERLSLWAYHSLAKSLSLFNQIKEAAYWWEKPKKGKQGTRLITEYGPLHRAAQYMVMRVISVAFKPRPYQFDIGGRGREKAIELITGKEAEGFWHVAKFDVANFFGSFSREPLYDLLPLPKDVIDHVVMPVDLELKPKKGGKSKKAQAPPSQYTMSDDTNIIHDPQCQPGPPQGSMCSPIIAAYLMAMMKIELAPEVALIIFVDDILIMARNSVDLDAVKHALLSSFGESPAGTFKLVASDQTFTSGIDFLGYQLKYGPGQFLKLQPTLDNILDYHWQCDGWEKEIKKVHKSKHSPDAVRKALAGYLLYRCSWLNAFEKSSDIADMVAYAQNRILALCNNYGEFAVSVMTLAKVKFPYQHVKCKYASDGYATKPKSTADAIDAFLSMCAKIDWTTAE